MNAHMEKKQPASRQPRRVTYRSASAISVNLTLADPPQRIHLRFLPLAEGGSVTVTDSPRLQQALESHPRFGSLFVADPQPEQP